jgi:hypothetical protein
VAVGFGLASGVVMSELSALLRSMHLPAQPSGDLSQGLFQMSGLGGGAADAFEVVAAWEAFLPRAEAATELAAITVAGWWLLVDGLFILSYLYVGLALIGRGGLLRTRQLAMGSVFDLATLGLLLLAVVDVIENTLAWLTISWAADPVRIAEAADGSFSTLWLPNGLRVAAGAKSVLAVLVVLPIAVAGVVAIFVMLRQPETRQGLVMSRTQILAVVVLAVAMLAPLQLPDVILGWDAVATLTALGLALMFSGSTWLWSRLLIQADLHRPGGVVPRPPQAWVSAAVAAVGALVAVGLWLYNGDEYNGLAVAVGLVVAVIILSIPARSVSVPHRQQPMYGSLRLPVILALLPLVFLGVGLLSATVAWVVFHAPAYVKTSASDLGSLWDVIWKPLLGLALVVVPLGAMGQAWKLARRYETPLWNPRIGLGRSAAGLATLGLIVVAVPAILVAVVVVADPWRWAPRLGVVAIVLAALTFVSYIGGLAVAATQGLTNRIGVPGAFRVFGLARIPIVTLVVIWAFINTLDLVDPVNHHDVRVAAASDLRSPAAVDDSSVGMQQSLGAAFATWHSEVVGDPIDGACVPEPGEECVYPATPLILVAAEGGGIRAAYWTASALDCLFEPRQGAPEGCAPPDEAAARPDGDHLFIASGASGGSVGIAAYVAQTELAASVTGAWVEETFGNDFLAPELGWWLFAELPRSLIHFEVMDRAEVHERSFERAFVDDQGSLLTVGLRSLYANAGDNWIPRMMLSGASVLDGCQVNVSHLNVGVNPRPTEGDPFPGCLSLDQYSQAGVPAGVGPLAGAIDLVDMLCPEQDIRLSTAALLSSRFPFVSPAGRLVAADCAPAGSSIESVKYVVDGGYVDNTGGMAIANMVPTLDRLVAAQNRGIQRHGHCVVPFLVQIDNGGENPAAPGGTPEIDGYSAPLQAIAAASSQSRDARVKALAAGEFSRPLQHTTTGGDVITVKLDGEPVLNRYARVFPFAEPALDAPLGWVLSQASMELLDRQLIKAVRGGETEPSGIEAARSWLDGALTCTVAAPPPDPRDE